MNDNSETKWHYHHRDETDKGYKADELCEMGEYTDIPPEKLILLPEKIHRFAHCAGLIPHRTLWDAIIQGRLTPNDFNKVEGINDTICSSLLDEDNEDLDKMGLGRLIDELRKLRRLTIKTLTDKMTKIITNLTLWKKEIAVPIAYTKEDVLNFIESSCLELLKLTRQMRRRDRIEELINELEENNDEQQ